MIQCSRLITRHAHRLRHLTHGNHLIVTRYYMVKSDGAICIPWDLTFGEVSPPEQLNFCVDVNLVLVMGIRILEVRILRIRIL